MNLVDGVQYRFYVQTVNNVGSSDPTESDLISIHHKHIILGSGRFGIDEMAEKLENDKVLCGLFTLDLFSKRLTLRLDFVGKNASAEAHGEAKAKHDRVNAILGRYDAELGSFDDKKDFSAKNVIDLMRGKLDADPDVKGTPLSKLVEIY